MFCELVGGTDAPTLLGAIRIIPDKSHTVKYSVATIFPFAHIYMLTSVLRRPILFLHMQELSLNKTSDQKRVKEQWDAIFWSMAIT